MDNFGQTPKQIGYQAVKKQRANYKKKIFKEPTEKRALTGHSPYAFIIVGSTALNAKNLLKQTAAGLRYVRIGKASKHRHLAGFERQQGKNGKTKLFRAYAIF